MHALLRSIDREREGEITENMYGKRGDRRNENIYPVFDGIFRVNNKILMRGVHI